MVVDFVDREAELAALERAWGAPEASLVLLWGRRRTGKTRLLGRFVEQKRAVFHAATQQASAVELRGLATTVRQVLKPTGADLLALGDFPDWSTAFDYLGEQAKDERLVVVLDEFPYLVASEPALPAIIQRFWDHRGRQSRLMLILCGSAQTMMEELQSQRAPLFGRATLRLRLRPFGHREAALFLPNLRPAECALAYGVLGGMPPYLERWDDRTSAEANLYRLFADPTSPLVDEGEFVLSSELPEAAGYFRILQAIASGHRTYGAIKNRAEIDVERQLGRLLRLGLVERVVPVTEDPTRSKRAVYRITDNFLAFWFRFLHPHRATVARGLGREVVDRIVLPGLADHMGEPWEEMCREHIRFLAARGRLGAEVSAVGRWWNRDGSAEIDVVATRGTEVALVGSAKWARTAGGWDLRQLHRAAAALPNAASDLRFALFAREHVEDVGPGVMTFTAADLYP